MSTQAYFNFASRTKILAYIVRRMSSRRRPESSVKHKRLCEEYEAKRNWPTEKTVHKEIQEPMVKLQNFMHWLKGVNSKLEKPSIFFIKQLEFDQFQNYQIERVTN